MLEYAHWKIRCFYTTVRGKKNSTQAVELKVTTCRQIVDPESSHAGGVIWVFDFFSSHTDGAGRAPGDLELLCACGSAFSKRICFVNVSVLRAHDS